MHKMHNTNYSTIIVQKNSFASVLFVTSLNQFFLSFLVPVAIEIGSESRYFTNDIGTELIIYYIT